MLRVEFLTPVKGLYEVVCNGLSIDPMDHKIFLIQVLTESILETPLNNIKHISSYESK